MSRPIGRLPFAAQRLLQTHPLYDGMLTQDLYDGTYTYSAGKGTMKLYVDFSSFDTFETTFSISGTTMTVNLKGETFSLTQE